MAFVRTGRRMLLAALIIVLAGCNLSAPGENDSSNLHVRVIDGNKEPSVYVASPSMSISEFLRQNNIDLGSLDRSDPPLFTQVTDNLTVTITRVREEEQCDEKDLPFETKYVDKQDLAPGDTKLAQAGVTGRVKVCSMVLYENDVEKSRIESGQTILSNPSDEIIWRGFTKPEPVAVTGKLFYISDGQARIIQTNSQNDHPLPAGSTLDGYVFTLSDDGKALIYTAKPDTTASTPAVTDSAAPAATGSHDVFNTLYVLLDITDPEAKPIRLFDNILTADWVPNQPYTFSFSTLLPRDQFPGYQALNDFTTIRIDPKTGLLFGAKPLVKSGPTGVYGYWGTNFKWSPDGKHVAWSQADGAGLVDFTTKNGKLTKLLDFAVYSTTLSLNWIWTPTLSWSPDSSLFATTIHGKPIASEAEDTSPVFDLMIAQVGGLFTVPLAPQVGMWAAPTYSPMFDDGTGNLFGYLAYLKARTPINSVSSEYDLVIADRDGSNERVVFPGSDKPGLQPIKNRFGNEIVWGVDGRQVVLNYQGDLWIVDIQSGQATRITYTGDAYHPRWIR